MNFLNFASIFKIFSPHPLSPPVFSSPDISQVSVCVSFLLLKSNSVSFVCLFFFLQKRFSLNCHHGLPLPQTGHHLRANRWVYLIQMRQSSAALTHRTHAILRKLGFIIIYLFWRWNMKEYCQFDLIKILFYFILFSIKWRILHL